MRESRRLFVILCVALMVACMAGPCVVLAQKPPLPIINRDSHSTILRLTLPATDAEIDKAIARLESRIADFRVQSEASVETTTDASEGVLLAGTPEELRKRERLLSELVITLDKNMQSLQELKNVRKLRRDHSAEIQAWKGFTEKPPFPISFLDSLRDSLVAQRLDKQTLDVRLSVVKGDLQQYTKGLKEGQQVVRLTEEQFQKSRGKADESRQLWVRDLAQLQNSLNEAGAASSEVQRLVLEEAINDRNEYIQFLEQKLTLAEGVSPLSKADLDQKLQELDAQRKTLEDELRQTMRDDKDAGRRLREFRDVLSKIQEEISQRLKPLPNESEKVRLLQSGLEAQQCLAEAMSEKVNILKRMLNLIDVSQTIWKDRYELTQDSDLARIKEIQERTQRVLASVRLWIQYVNDRLSSWVMLTQSQRDKVDVTDKTEAERKTDRIILKAYEERQAMLIRGGETLTRVERLANRLNDELIERKENSPIESRLKEVIAAAGSLIKRIWNTELYVAEETIIAEGNKIVKPVGVTVGKGIQALIILIIGIWMAGLLMRPIRWIVIKRFKKDESVAQQISKVTFLVLFFVVLVLSFIFVNIPLAVFAFLGGALAIGVGFGAQNIINNFISSLILLFDHSIKAGDIVEVDGQGGRVISVGMRCSHVMGFDGMEFLVPNSQFLQQKVTNWTLSVRRRRYSISVSVVYGSPTAEVSRLILKAVGDHKSVLKDPAPVVLLEDFADNALTFQVYFWLDLISPIDNRIILSDMRHDIARLLAEAGIVIPFPQRDVHIDSAKPIEIKVIS